MIFILSKIVFAFLRLGELVLHGEGSLETNTHRSKQLPPWVGSTGSCRMAGSLAAPDCLLGPTSPTHYPKER